MLAWLRLIRAKGLRNANALVLLERFGSADAVCAANAAQWLSVGAERAKVLLPDADDAQVQADAAWLAGGADRHLVTLQDARYPEQLKNITTPPLALFVRGDCALLAQPQLAMVGARSATPQGLENARGFAAELSRRGVLITSGLAIGVDGAAHAGALDAKAPTIAVCGTGLDRVYPARHKALAQAILDGGGALVSEFAPGTEALPQNFPSRNRIISGLSLGVLVVEASRDSGSLITARRAMEQGREVFAIPGSIHNPLAKGCHQLIREGAKLVESVDDVLLELAPKLGAWLREQAPVASVSVAPTSDDAATASLLAALTDAPQSVDALITTTGLSPEQVNTALLMLELDGRAGSAAGGGFMRLQRR
ncbi:MAG: DNA-processing protein DprA [Stagnimonas sp.]|nr:DNA-processing protein DprA [Stagnimonas sp.]